MQQQHPRRYPPILPSGPLPTPESAISRRQRPGACVHCRKSKTKCDGVRPKCSHCVKRGVVTCIYLDKIKAGPEVMEVLELLKSLPEERAIALLGVFREGGDLITALSAFKENISEEAGSALEQNPATARSPLESELMASNAKTYPPLPPINSSVLANSNLLRPVRPSTDAHASGSIPPIGASAGAAGRQFPLPTGSTHEVEYCDERLHDLQVAFWTDVMITNDFAARIISLYITTDHPLLGLFSPRLFITDLVNQQNRFCSRFLFHALMYLGCQMYSAIDGNAMQHAAQFYEETEMLWVEQQDSYLTMAGAILLSLSLIGNSRDHSILFYATQAMEMGKRLGLLKAEEEAAISLDKNMSEDESKAYSYAAWGVFNWNVHISLFYRQPESESPGSLPTIPIPREIASGKAAVGSSRESVAYENLLEGIFPAVCQFWQIIHGAEWIYNPTHDSPPARYRMALAEHVFRELLAWVDALPSSLLRTAGGSQQVTVLHIWLHAAILDIFRPFIGHPEGQRPRLTTFSAADSSPDMVYTASVNQLKHLIVQYRSESISSTYSILWHTGLLYLANAMLKNTTDPEWHLYLLLCIYGYESLSRPYRISETIVQGILSMTMRESHMTGTEANRIINEIRQGRLENVKNDIEHEIRAKFMGDMELALEDPEAARVENLAAQFDYLALFQDFLNQEQMDIPRDS